MTRKERNREAARRWRERHPERARESQRKYRESHPEVLAARRKAYYEANRERELARSHKWNEAHPGYWAAWTKRYRAANPEKFYEYDSRRRARKLNTQTEPIRRLAIAERDGWRCHICKKKIHGKGELALDHLIPLAAGGPHLARNIAAAHRRCNQKRSAGWLPAQLRLIS